MRFVVDRTGSLPERSDDTLARPAGHRFFLKSIDWERELVCVVVADLTVGYSGGGASDPQP